MDQWINMTTKCKTIRLPDESDWDRPLLTRTGGGWISHSPGLPRVMWVLPCRAAGLHAQRLLRDAWGSSRENHL